MAPQKSTTNSAEVIPGCRDPLALKKKGAPLKLELWTNDLEFLMKFPLVMSSTAGFLSISIHVYHESQALEDLTRRLSHSIRRLCGSSFALWPPSFPGCCKTLQDAWGRNLDKPGIFNIYQYIFWVEVAMICGILWHMFFSLCEPVIQIQLRTESQRMYQGMVNETHIFKAKS